MYEYKFKVPKNIQKYFNNTEIKVTSEMPLRESEGGNIYNIGVTAVKSAITSAINEQTDEYESDTLHDKCKNDTIKSLERIHVVGHLGIVVAELHSDSLGYKFEICVVNKYNGGMKIGDWMEVNNG